MNYEIQDHLSPQQQIDRIIAQIKQDFAKPGSRPMTSNELKNQADRRRNMATNVLLHGGQVNEDYQPMGGQ